MSRQRRWLSRTYARSERVVTRKIGSELVLVPLANHGADIDSIFNLQGAAPFIWDLLDGTRSGDSIVDAIVGEYDVTRPQAAADYVELLEKLDDLGFAVADMSVRARRAARVQARRPPLARRGRRTGSGRTSRRPSRRRKNSVRGRR